MGVGVVPFICKDKEPLGVCMVLPGMETMCLYLALGAKQHFGHSWRQLTCKGTSY